MAKTMLKKVSKSKNTKESMLSKTWKTYLPGTSAIGSGYNIFGYFANTRSLKQQLFNWSNLDDKEVLFKPGFVVPQVIQVNNIEYSEYTSKYGVNINELQASMNQGLNIDGKYKLFSAELKSRFDELSFKKVKNEYSYINENIQKWELVLTDFKNAKKALRLTVKDDLENQEPEVLFDTYGTHFLTSIIVGGKVTYSSITDETAYKNEQAFNIVAKQSYKEATFQLTSEEKKDFQQNINNCL